MTAGINKLDCLFMTSFLKAHLIFVSKASCPKGDPTEGRLLALPVCENQTTLKNFLVVNTIAYYASS